MIQLEIEEPEPPRLNSSERCGAAIDPLPGLTLLERGLPFGTLSSVALRDQRAPDPALATHRWWARRPPAVFRGLLLAATLPSTTSEDEFWHLYQDASPHLTGWTIYDPFVGGGTTLIEAQRLGARALGTDIDPLAVQIVRHALKPPELADLREASDQLLAYLQDTVAPLYEESGSEAVPLHYFYIRVVRCPFCDVGAPLYRDPILARDNGKAGSVARRHALEVFCPLCFKVHHLDRREQTRFRCCGRHHDLESGTYERFKFTCPTCGVRSSHKQLQTGAAELKLVAVEELLAGRQPRAFRTPTQEDESRRVRARRYCMEQGERLHLPTSDFSKVRLDARPLSFGITKPAQLFSDRQLALFGTAFSWIEAQNFPTEVTRALRLAISHSLATNNMLCGYARDYGRLAPLFSVRSYALPSLAVELNPFVESAGRGTIRRNLERVSKASDTVSRYVWRPPARKPERSLFRFTRPREDALVRCADASEGIGGDVLADLAVFDPPYFDYIAYSELSEFYRAWWPDAMLVGNSLLPERDRPIQSFASSLAQALTTTIQHIKPNALLAFTFHSASADAWEALGRALDGANISVTGLSPVLADARMGHHSYDGNCEWDIAITCRRTAECIPASFYLSLETWIDGAKPHVISIADRKSMALALALAARRFATPAGPQGVTL